MTRLTGVRTGDQPKNWRATTRGLAGDAPRTVTCETPVACGEHVETRRPRQETSGGRDQTARLTRLTTSRTKLEEASTDGSAHSTQGRFPGMTISDELLQMIEKMSEKPDKERTITTALSWLRWRRGNTGSPTR